ncbi:DEAD/DEAH box helicase [Flavobacteriaceae bacterium]|nr:DEAD/DEAH box helicase [Flavobacteriaceae bacterium]
MSKLFSDLGISLALQQGLSDLNITEPTYIQQKAIPILLKQSEDVVALAKTGTGKTAAFGLPLLDLIDVESKHIQVVILAPTRELGQQIHSNLEGYAKHLPLVSIASVCGGIPIKPQIERLKTPTQIVVATPGRLLDLVGREAIQLNKLSYLVLDEADEMVNNFQQELESIIKEIPKKRRTLLFTATLSGAVKQLVQNYMSKHVVQIEDHTNGSVNLGIDHHYTVVTPIEKLDVLMHFLSARTGQRGLIFCKTKAAVNKLGKNLAINKFSSGLIHGSLTQGIRDRIMGQFREGHIDILVATDLAARGIDVQEISYVVHYHLPDTYDTYVHRSGRTARAGAKGFSLSILQEEELKDIPEFEKELGIKFNEFKKGDTQSIEENNGFLWAKKIFKTKPNQEISPSFREQIGTVFHHLTKEELIDKLLADYVNTTKTLRTKEAPVKRLKKR